MRTTKRNILMFAKKMSWMIPDWIIHGKHNILYILLIWYLFFENRTWRQRLCARKSRNRTQWAMKHFRPKCRDHRNGKPSAASFSIRPRSRDPARQPHVRPPGLKVREEVAEVPRILALTFRDRFANLIAQLIGDQRRQVLGRHLRLRREGPTLRRSRDRSRGRGAGWRRYWKRERDKLEMAA